MLRLPRYWMYVYCRNKNASPLRGAETFRETNFARWHRRFGKRVGMTGGTIVRCDGSQFATINRHAIRAVAKTAMRFRVDRVADRLHRTITKTHIKCIGVGRCQKWTNNFPSQCRTCLASVGAMCCYRTVVYPDRNPRKQSRCRRRRCHRHRRRD